ncbi:ATP-binding cassette domain-containing protein [Thermaerobacter sp. FW80]|uniref:ATP-binding cassette domain-containing protein n=1 Tax=Thermaerobacter sp. FW80 TaxID=2546351 RepID=UPI0010757C2C|nr:ATP-binding cassette domain-containing protein [Thermaerobacter sp. FW80]QBS36870.1 ATP-binding cassette domain-containing protein [Thermaerobacter sp. FW80]
MIEVEGLSRTFGAVTAVDAISFTVREGEIFGFLGPNGAGKSTTIQMLATLLPPSGGTARLAGFDIRREPRQVRRQIGIVFQDPSLDNRLTAEENLRLHARLYGVPAAVYRQRAAELLEMVGLADRRHALVATFSGGMKRRLEIARGLLHLPRILFLDEPTVGLDPQTRAAIWDYVHRLRERTGVTVFMTTHYLDEAEHCDRIAIIDHGRTVALDTPAALKRSLGGDVVYLRPREGVTPAALAKRLGADLGVQAEVAGDRVAVRTADASTLAPRLLAAVGSEVVALEMRQPSLDDVFLALTGRAIRDEEPAGNGSWRPPRARLWGGRR